MSKHDFGEKQDFAVHFEQNAVQKKWTFPQKIHIRKYIWQVQKKKTEFRQSQKYKKKTEFNHWTSFSAHGGGPGPSLGF